MKWPMEVKLTVDEVRLGASLTAGGTTGQVIVRASSGSPYVPHKVELAYLLEHGERARDSIPHVGDTITITVDDGVEPS